MFCTYRYAEFKKMCLGNVVILIEIEMIIDNFNEVSQECFQP